MSADAKVKRFVQDNHMSIFLLSLAFIAGLTVVFGLVGAGRTVSLGAVGVLLSFVYFVQKQQLEEAKLIKDLVTEFNAGYDELNEELNGIVGSSNPGLESTQKDTLYNYFNLCAEEYLFYRRGYIYPEVWEAWARGMEACFTDDYRIRNLWECESKTGSYYGLDFDTIFSALPNASSKELG